jgi:[ribosomal protein S5]-alanine N-acetyltransferase
MKSRVILRPPARSDRAEFIAAARRSRSLHHPWIKAPDTAKAFEDYLERVSRPDHCGFLVIDRQNGGLIGVLNVGAIVRGPFQSGFLGYWVFAGWERRGLMREAMQLLLAHVFNKLKLHRIEANIQPGNLASLKFIQDCRFVREGFSRRYLKVYGRWRDHEHWAMLAEDWKQNRIPHA